MKEFVKDYWQLTKASGAFIKKHPIGTAVYMLVSGAIGVATPFVYAKIEDRKFQKELARMNNITLGDDKED